MVVATVHGKGYDSGGKHPKTIKRKHTKCYRTWQDMVRRYYSKTYQEKNETYKGCEVCHEWLDFQNFAGWFDINNVPDFELDKDILGEGKLYSPSTCAFIPKRLNLLLVNRRGKSRNYQLPLGVSKSETKLGVKYTAYCNNGEGKTVNLGTRSTPEEAALLYIKYKNDLIKKVADGYLSQGAITEDIHTALMAKYIRIGE